MFFDRDLFESASDGCTSYGCGCLVYIALFVAAIWWLRHYFT